VANKGGVRGDGTAGRLLTMARPGLRGRQRSAGSPEGGRRSGGAHVGEGGEGKAGWAGWPVSRHEGGGRWAMAGSKTGNGSKFQNKFFSNFN
jgi:hypothetical protein